MVLYTRLLAGALLLLFGRKLFWLYVAALGFTLGMMLATQVFNIQREDITFIVGLAFGIGGALLAIFLQNIAIGVAGFLGGAYILNAAAGILHLGYGQATWMIYLVGGILGFILMTQVFDFALVMISSLLGTAFVVGSLNLTGGVMVTAMIVLFGLGVVVQMGQESPRRQDE